jgi:putative endopeptidase
VTILDDARPGMKPEIRPQDDLFGHVNGRWLDEVEIPSDRSSWGPFVELSDAAEVHVQEIITDLAAQDPALLSEDARKIAALYDSFMDEATVEELGLEPILPMLDEVARIVTSNDLAGFLGRLSRIGGSGLFGWYVDADDRNSDRYLVSLRQGGLGLPDESYYREEKFAGVREKYAAYLERLFEMAGLDAPAVAATSVVALETQLAAGHWERSETRDVQKTYNLTALEQLKELAPAFEWDTWVENLGGTAQTLAESCVRQPSYLGHLSKVLSETEIAAWRPWLMSRVLRSAAAYLPHAFVENEFDFYSRTLNGTPELRPRWKRGVALVQGAIGEAVGEEYVARHFPPVAKAMMDDLVANLLEAYRRSIEALDWMGEQTKQRAYEKLATFRPKIGYPEKFRDYSALTLHDGDLIGNVVAAAKFETERELAKIGAPVDRDEWFMLPQTVNAYYNPGTNEICFPAAILQKPVFSPDADPAENYGGIGAVIGHEVGHGFDDQGAQYDGTGNLNDWWSEDDKAAFKVKSQALIEQYDGFEPRALGAGHHVNGALTVGENIGDLGGLTIAHKAYLISLEDAPMPEADGLTGSQRLFMSWAYVWRTKRRTEQELQYLTIDPHSPPEFRANIVRNLDEFHEAFDTTEGDDLWLAPGDRVRIW